MPGRPRRHRPFEGPTAFGYVRVSTQHQADSGSGIEAQQETILRYYEYALKPKGLAWGGFYTDPGESGATPLRQRRAGHKLDAVIGPDDAVIFAKLDRGFRNVIDFGQVTENWNKRRVQMHLLDLNVDTSTPIGRLVAGILAQVAEWERHRIAERTRESIKQRRRTFKPLGEPPYGYKIAGPKGKRHFVPDPDERKVGKMMVKWHMEGYSMRAILSNLQLWGVQTRKGTNFSLYTVWSYIKRELKLMSEEAAAASKAAKGHDSDTTTADEHAAN